MLGGGGGNLWQTHLVQLSQGPRAIGLMGGGGGGQEKETILSASWCTEFGRPWGGCSVLVVYLV